MTYLKNFQNVASENEFFRNVLYTGKRSQLVAMSLAPGEEIGAETHPSTDQTFFFIDGTGEATIDHKPLSIAAGEVLCVPAGTLHNVRNTSKRAMKLLTLYAPPEHPAGTIEKTRDEAVAAHAHAH
jgi:mannose-6-phosphate isomerase-like protein (cupin superfamily)